MAAAPCKECGQRPKAPGRHRCVTCALRHEPIGDQVAASARRLAMVPEPMRRKRTKTIQALAPAGTAWCAGCQSFRDLVDFGKGATTCRACSSAKSHATMVAKTYGLGAGDYERLLAAQGGRCAICRARPKSKRLAVDHDHKTGAVRGLLCSRCNHDLMGSAWDSMAMASALWHYMNTPPATGGWVPPEEQSPLVAERPSAAPSVDDGLVTVHGGKAAPANGKPRNDGECTRPHYLPIGSESVPGKRGVWRIWVEPDGEAPF
jgi:hypothetical protein